LVLMKNSSDLEKAIQAAIRTTESFHEDLLRDKAHLESKLGKFNAQQDNATRFLLKLGETAAARVNSLVDDLETKKNVLLARLGEIDSQLLEVKIPADLKQRTDRIVAALIKLGGPMTWDP
jgi:hypothetical protein